ITSRIMAQRVGHCVDVIGEWERSGSGTLAPEALWEAIRNFKGRRRAPLFPDWKPFARRYPSHYEIMQTIAANLRGEVEAAGLHIRLIRNQGFSEDRAV